MIGLAASIGNVGSWIGGSLVVDSWIGDFWLGDSSAIAQQRRCGGSLLRRLTIHRHSADYTSPRGQIDTVHGPLWARVNRTKKRQKDQREADTTGASIFAQARVSRRTAP